jgi:hypothetical protein
MYSESDIIKAMEAYHSQFQDKQSVDWEKLRDKFEDECVDYHMEIPFIMFSDPTIIFAWFKDHLSSYSNNSMSSHPHTISLSELDKLMPSDEEI